MEELYQQFARKLPINLTNNEKIGQMASGKV